MAQGRVANLSNTNMKSVVANSVSLENADLYRANLTGATFAAAACAKRTSAGSNLDFRQPAARPDQGAKCDGGVAGRHAGDGSAWIRTGLLQSSA
ncbi:MAG: pentapeptide repeat-containing protein [Solirubrobacteraceae bacterium]